MNELNSKETLGFIGLGSMGNHMAANLVTAGYDVYVFDLDPSRVDALVKQGARAAESAKAAILQASVVLLSLPDSNIAVKVVEAEVLPNVQKGQIIIDMGTMTPPETRRLAGELSQKGAYLLDTPVAGGQPGAEKGMLHIFAGGDQEIFKKCLPLLEVLGDKEHITYGGESGNGQILKSVNQMTMGLLNAAYLESLAFGVLSGIDPATVSKAMNGDGAWRKAFCAIADKVVEGKGLDVGVKVGQFPYFLEEAAEKEFDLPLSKALYGFCENGEKVVMEVNRLSPSFWKELTEKHSK